MQEKLAILAALLGMAYGQGTGTYTTETHPKMTWQKCTAAGSCTEQDGSVVIDSNWRWVHVSDGYTNCYTGNTWNSTVCSDDTTCASKCVLDGADYEGTYGATTSGNALTLKFVTKGSYATNIGSRLYLMASDTEYQMFTLLNNEFTFDVDVSQLGCGLNGALYFSVMDSDGGMAKYPTNKAGAKYGTGYCDSQCARDLKFIGGKANVQGWTASSNDQNAGVGDMGACCSEMDVWEANSHSSAFTAHPCTTIGYNVCNTDTCGGTYSSNRFAGNCDPNGCDFNPYRMGVTDFYGDGKTVDTSKVFTVVTQFKSSEIHQFFVQGGQAIDMPNSTVPGATENRLNADYCAAQFNATNSTDRFSQVGGWTVFNQAMADPWVLVMSLWDDHYANMLWLDSTYPTDQTGPGVDRGDCATSSGVPSDVESQQASAQVIYSNIRFGPIGSTVSTELYR